VSVARPSARIASIGVALVGLILLVVSVLPGAGLGDAGDYGRELARLGDDIAQLRGGEGGAPDGGEGRTRLAYLLYRRASLTGNASDLAEVNTSIAEALRQIGPSDDLYLLRTNLDFKLHRLDEAREDLALLQGRSRSPEVLALRGDLAVQEGRYDAARREYDLALHAKRTWDVLARLAYLEFLTGNVPGAEHRFRQAEEEITAKEMRAYAWVELQRGYVAFSRGRLDQALERYRTAARAYSGYWLVDEYTAEVLGAQQRFDEAAALYRAVIARAPRPEIQQALGDLCAFMGEAAEARRWHDQALAGYLASVRRGEVQYLHHLAAFYADVLEDGASAVEWARRDFQLRQNVAAYDTLAWALYRHGAYDEAHTAIRGALAPGVEDAHLFVHAAMITLAAGQMDEGRRLLQRAAAVNPYFARFHEHR
jgi:tetratricopeptide (TPR) repeat protein